MRWELERVILLGLLLSSDPRAAVDGFTTTTRTRTQTFGRPSLRRTSIVARHRTPGDYVCKFGAGTSTSIDSSTKDGETSEDENDISPARDPKTPSDGPEQDVSKTFSHSRDKAISALSQPPTTANPKEEAISKLAKSGGRSKRRRNNESTNGRPSRNGGRKSRDSLLPKATVGFQKDKDSSGETATRDNITSSKDKASDDESFFSLLPPPFESESSSSAKADSLSNGLSSWEDFLGAGNSPKSSGSYGRAPSRPQRRDIRSSSKPAKVQGDKRNTSNKSNGTGDDRLPSIADLFPPDFSTVGRNRDQSIDDEDDMTGDELSAPLTPGLDGVLPVSDLFYRSSQSMNEDEDPSRDDEELPFSAEQTDSLATGNRIRVRRNQAKSGDSATTTKPLKRTRKSSSTPRKMIRRGMEMLVGGVPINADPPQRYVDLMYVHKEAQNVNWHEVISMNTRDFGPMLHGPSVGLISKVEQGLFCEHFVHYTSKWDVCPKDLRTIVKSFAAGMADRADDGIEYDEVADFASSGDEGAEQASSDSSSETSYSARGTNSLENAAQGFGTLTSYSRTSPIDPDDEESELEANLGGELVFCIGVSREELESSDSLSEVPVLERVLARGIASSTDCSGFAVVFTKLVLTDMDDGTTMISGDFRLILKDNESLSFGEMERKAHRINSSLAAAMDEGDMQLAMAAAAREERAWPEALRNRVVEEFLFDDDVDVGDGSWESEDVQDQNEDSTEEYTEADDDEIPFDVEHSLQSLEENESKSDDVDGPFGLPGSVEHNKDDLFLGGGNDGLFWNYSEENAENSPYSGALGLRLVDAVMERAKERQPRVIAIGDVHGCIDELQELLRQCGYRPGDLVVFLGDLVSKGPDSVSVVQMAREIGAIGVRGNHDFEVIRWHQAIKSGVDPPVVGSEHFHIASCLTKADMKWMYSLPWYISSRELGALFVHAGFVSGIRLGKQNPRLMMNMRSILPDGTVTSKFFNNWPWARLWDGPQTVLFGHDADRGLQQYEHAIGLDTGCVYGGRLTACILPEKRLVSVSARREYFKYRRKHYD